LIQYRYAIENSTARVVDISAVAHRDAAGYTCPGCDRPLVARLGVRNRHHFAHKAENPDCAFETYLHIVAKCILYYNIDHRIALREPFYLLGRQTLECGECMKRGMRNKCGLEVLPYEINLLREDSTIAMEQPWRGYRPDLLLSSGAESIAIEIEVHHPCEVEKLLAFEKVVELRLRSEDQLEYLYGNSINPKEIDSRLRGIGVQKRTVDLPSGELCEKQVVVFSVSSFGKARYIDTTIANLQEIRKRSAFSKEYADEVAAANTIKADVLEALAAGVSVKDCHLCQHRVAQHATDSIRPRAVLCGKHNYTFSSNEAEICRYFESDEERRKK
jgi:hypothetical protein